LLLALVFSCKEDVQEEQIAPAEESSNQQLSKDLVFGEWQFDYSTSDYVKRHYLFITEDSNYYMFAMWNGGGMTDRGSLFSEDSIKGKYFWKYKYALIDSSNMYIIDRNGFNNDTNYYYKITYSDYHESLASNLQSDSLRNKLLGWWKLEKSQYPIKLHNYPEPCDQFTLNIRHDGTAVFFLENNLDSTVEYGYNVGQDYINFERGCTGTYSYVNVEQNKMKLKMSKYDFDTLQLKRITKI